MDRLWALAVMVPALAAQVPAPDRGVNFYSFEKEQALGAQLAAEYRRNAAVIDSAFVNRWLRDLGERIAAHVQGPPFPYSFQLVDDDRTFLHEPVAFPGGPVFVPAALILEAKSEDELAGMMAHSIAHIAARHGTKLATRGELVNIAMVPLIYMGGWTGYAIRQGEALAIPLGFAKFQRQSELQADILAIQAMSVAGYNPEAYADYIERVQPRDALPAPVYRPFPEREPRVAALRAAIPILPAAVYAPHTGFAAVQEEVAHLSAKPAQAPPRLAR